MSEHDNQNIDNDRILELELTEVIPDENHDFQVREQLSQEKVNAIAEYLKSATNNQQTPYPIPIYVYKPDDSNKYIIVDGWHRFVAHQQAGLSKIYAIVLNYDEAVECGLKANIVRAEHNCMEKSDAIDRLYKKRQEKDKEYTRKQLGLELALSEGSISDYFVLQELPEEIKVRARNDALLSVITMRSIARSKRSKEEKIKLYNERLEKAQKRYAKSEEVNEKSPEKNTVRKKRYVTQITNFSNRLKEFSKLYEGMINDNKIKADSSFIDASEVLKKEIRNFLYLLDKN
ncbi:ParB/RepB/Spo0J family partition protein [Mailhella massiliensis]|uniref:ParB/RepB/Spo0J family partition protein n=1 Tax=Mailhella massiliensis TaxID=1903261 RepID=UPI002357EBAB|nr:ParB N-terminal domain-containing protein [Mailhella massiliensis]